MKNVLITGSNSCVGMCIEGWLRQWPEKYSIDTLDMRDDKWKSFDFSGYDSVYHVAGIAHVSLDPSMEKLFFKINRDLTIETAKKAKQSGVNQFIFMSSGIVYGNSTHIGQKHIIGRDTKPNPANFYGASKLQAEDGLKILESSKFKVVIIRSPALYGLGMKSHYNKLSVFARKFPIFPNIKNQRSMLYNKNLAEFVRLMIENEEAGTFWPQNAEYICTSQLVKDIAVANGKHIWLTRLFNPILKISDTFFPFIDKVFGSFMYDQYLSEYKENYRVANYADSIFEIEQSVNVSTIHR